MPRYLTSICQFTAYLRCTKVNISENTIRACQNEDECSNSRLDCIIYVSLQLSPSLDLCPAQCSTRRRTCHTSTPLKGAECLWVFLRSNVSSRLCSPCRFCATSVFYSACACDVRYLQTRRPRCDATQHTCKQEKTRRLQSSALLVNFGLRGVRRKTALDFVPTRVKKVNNA